jgi:hypothetical protein
MTSIPGPPRPPSPRCHVRSRSCLPPLSSPIDPRVSNLGSARRIPRMRDTPTGPPFQSFQTEQGTAQRGQRPLGPRLKFRSKPSPAGLRCDTSRATARGRRVPSHRAHRPPTAVMATAIPAPFQGRPGSPPPRPLGSPGPARPSLLGLARPLTGTGARLPDLQQQDDDGRQMGQVPGQPEDVHGGGDR